ncbi:hypothetical protein BgiMline_006392, partial [Biomphalaria glabrata]
EHCLPLLCAPGKMFQDGSCVEIIEEVKGLPYQLVLWLVPLKTERLANNDTHSFSSKLDSIMDAILSK